MMASAAASGRLPEESWRFFALAGNTGGGGRFSPRCFLSSASFTSISQLELSFLRV